MFDRDNFPEFPEDPSVRLIEAILDERGVRVDATIPPHGHRPTATHALWICACGSRDDAPTWLIYADGDRLLWCRIADGAEAEDLVDAQLSAAGHTDPWSVLAWLRGNEPGPWPRGDGWGDARVVADLGRLLERS